MLNKKMLLSVLVIGCIATVASAGTWAYFSDTETSTGNTFTAGTLDMSLSDDDEDWSNGVVATWKSPENFKPGDTFQNTLKFTNTGTIDAHHLYFYTEGLKHNDPEGDNSNLMNAIIITSITERFNGVTTTNYASTIEQQVGNRDGVLTLAEFCNWRAGYYTFDDQSHQDDDVIAGGNQKDYDFILGFKFDENADNTYQGDSCGFDLRVVATQNSPTDGMVKLHE